MNWQDYLRNYPAGVAPGKNFKIEPGKKYRISSQNFQKFSLVERAVGDLLYAKSAMAFSSLVAEGRPALSPRFDNSVDRNLSERAYGMDEWEYVSVRSLFESSITAFMRAFDKNKGSPIKIEDLKRELTQDSDRETLDIVKKLRHENVSHPRGFMADHQTYFLLEEWGVGQVHLNFFNHSSFGGKIFRDQFLALIDSALDTIYIPLLNESLREAAERILLTLSYDDEGKICVSSGTMKIVDYFDESHREVKIESGLAMPSFRLDGEHLILQSGGLSIQELTEQCGGRIVNSVQR